MSSEVTSYLDEMTKTLNDHKIMYQLLNKRIELSEKEIEGLSEYQKNEVRISVIRTKTELNVLGKVIKEKENYFKNYFEQYTKDLEDMNNNYDAIFKLANTKKSSNLALKNLLDNANWQLINSKDEFKVAMYNKIKKILNNV